MSESRTETVMVRTTPRAKEKLANLAERVEDNLYEFEPWNNPIKDCTSMSGILHHIMAGNLSMQEIRTELIDAEKNRKERKEMLEDYHADK